MNPTCINNEQQEDHMASIDDSEDSTVDVEQPNDAIRRLTHRLTQLNDHVPFCARVTFCACVCSLFALFGEWPEAAWVVVTGIIVSWQSDVASVSQKSLHRLLGTTIGSVVALGAGGIAMVLLEHAEEYHSIFGLACVVVATYGFAHVACQSGHRTHYSAVLGCVTFCMVFLAFFDKTSEEDAWRVGFFRMINICLGSIIGSFASVLVFPVSTKTLIERNVTKLIQDTGKTCRAILATSAQPLPCLIALARREGQEDEAHMRYITCLESWRDTRKLFSLLPYDPLFRRFSKEKKRAFSETWRVRLALTLRMQTTLVMLDGLNRSRLLEIKEENMLTQLGGRLGALLESDSLEGKKEAAEQLLSEDIPALRTMASIMRCKLSAKDLAQYNETTTQRFVGLLANEQRHEHDKSLSVSSEDNDDLTFALGTFDEIGLTPKFFSSVQTKLFFYQLLQILVFRALRLDNFCARSEGSSSTMQKQSTPRRSSSISTCSA